jgi:hypothetical protein
MKYAAAMGMVGVGVSLAFAPSALAHDTYVDQGTGSDASNDCSQAASPCKNLARGIAQAGAGDKIFVQGPYVYTASIVLRDRKSLIAKDFVSPSAIPPTLDNGSAGKPDILNPSLVPAGHVAEAGKVTGFIIRSGTLPVEINAGMTLSHNQINEPGQITDDVSVGAAADATISHNTINDPTQAFSDPSDRQTAISISSSGRVKIVGNTITSFWEGIDVSGAGAHATIKHNTVSGTHEVSNYAGEAIIVLAAAARADIAENTVVDPNLTLSNGVVDGIGLLTNGSLVRNFVGPGFNQEMALNNNSKPVTIDSNVVTATTGNFGLIVSDDHADAASDAKIKNLTAWGPGDSVQLARVHVTIDSSIIGAGAITTFYGSNKCSISHSRGPVKQAGNKGCDGFQTTANPKFKSDGYHLKKTSPMIDKGNPNKPSKHARDIDGDKRALAGDCSAHHPKKRRDIGADEFKCP